MISVSALNRRLGSSVVGLFALLIGLGSAAAQTEAPATPTPGAPQPAPDAPVAPETPETPEAPAPSTPIAPEAPTTTPELEPSPPMAEPVPAPVAAAPAPAIVGEPAVAPPSSAPAGVADAGQSLPSDDDGAAKPRMFGAMFDIGVPDFTTLSFVYRPIDLARVHAGISYNGVSPGLRIGGEFLPLGWGPSLGVAYGHYFEGDANGVAGMFGSIDGNSSKLLENVGYDYFALRAGMEFGGDRFTFFARGGVSWLRMTIHELDAIIEPDPESNTTIEVKQDPVLNAFTPTIQLGMIVQI